MAHEQHVQQRAKRVEVARRRDLAAGGLLRRTISGIARLFACACACCHDLGDAEIAHHGIALGIEEDVGGSQIAVQNALGVGIVQRAGDGVEQRGDLLRRQGLPAARQVVQPRGQRAAGQIFHHEEGLRIEQRKVEDAHDGGMVQGG